MYIKSINNVVGYKDLPDGFNIEFNENKTYIVGANFQRKTTVGSLFNWCLTGTSLNGKEKEQVANDTKRVSNVIVDITFVDNFGIEHRLIRDKGKEIHLTLDGKEIKQENLAQFYKNKDIFLVAHNPYYFWTLEPKEQKDLVRNILPIIDSEETFELLNEYEQQVIKEPIENLSSYTDARNADIDRLGKEYNKNIGKIETLRSIALEQEGCLLEFTREQELKDLQEKYESISMNFDNSNLEDLKRNIEGINRRLQEIIKEDLEEVKTKFGDERLTKIKPAEGDIEEEDLIKEEQTIVALTHFGYIKRMPADTYKSQRRGGKGITGISTRADDFVTEIFTASTHDTILFFSNKGKLYRLRGYEIPEAGRTAKGTAIVNLLSLDPGEKITAVIPISNFAEGKYLLMATQKGFIKKTALTEYNSARKTGLQAITLKEEDELIAVRLTDGQDNVVLVTEDGMSITFSEQDVRPMGRTAQGVIGIKLGDGDKVIGMESIIDGANATLLAITEHGFGKRTDLDEYRVQNRGGRGVITYKVTQKTGKLVGIRVTDDSNDIMMITDTGTIIRISVKDVSVLGRSTQGVTLMRTNDGGKVVSIELVEPEETNEE